MNFGDILDEWERETAKPYGKKRIKEDTQRATVERDSERESSPDSASGGSTAGSGAKPSGSGRCLDSERAAKRASEHSAGHTGNDTADVQKRANPMDVWLRRYGIQDKDRALEVEAARLSPADERRRLRQMRPDASLDLHGLTRDEAWSRLTLFFADAKRRGFKKVLIIHGKGTHSDDSPVLGQLVRRFLEQCHYAGESGSSDRASGGSGSTWVLLK